MFRGRARNCLEQVSLYTQLFLSHLVCSSIEKEFIQALSMEYDTSGQGLHRGASANLLSAFPRHSGALENLAEKEFRLAEGGCTGGAEQLPWIGLMGREWAWMVPVCSCCLSIPTLMGLSQWPLMGLFFKHFSSPLK